MIISMDYIDGGLYRVENTSCFIFNAEYTEVRGVGNLWKFTSQFPLRVPPCTPRYFLASILYKQNALENAMGRKNITRS